MSWAFSATTWSNAWHAGRARAPSRRRAPSCFPDIRGLDGDAERLCRQLLDRARVALVPEAARWFGSGAGGHVRIFFTTSRRTLQEAFDRLDNAVKEMVGGQLANPAK